MRDHIILADNLGDTTYIRTDYGSATAKGFGTDEWETLVKAREHKDIYTVHYVGHCWGGLVAEEADCHVASLLAMT